MVSQRYAFGDMDPERRAMPVIGLAETDHDLTEALTIIAAFMSPETSAEMDATFERACTLMDRLWFDRAAFYGDEDGDE